MRVATHSCALDDSGVVCWGDNGYGQITVPALSNPVAVSAGGCHSCALDDSGVVCWGRNNVRPDHGAGVEQPGGGECG